MQSRISGGMDLGRPPPTLTYPSHPVVPCPHYPINGKVIGLLWDVPLVPILINS
jgi:hypothetical protein